jgi:hypothetical protein
MWRRDLWWTIALAVSVGSRQGRWMILGWNKNPETYSCSSQFLLFLKSYGFISITLNRTLQKCQSTSSPSLRWRRPSSTLFIRLGTLGFLLFGYAKWNLMGYWAKNLSELLIRIQVMLRAIPSETLVKIFLEWTKRLQRCIDMNKEFVEWIKSY